MSVFGNVVRRADGDEFRKENENDALYMKDGVILEKNNISEVVKGYKICSNGEIPFAVIYFNKPMNIKHGCYLKDKNGYCRQYIYNGNLQKVVLWYDSFSDYRKDKRPDGHKWTVDEVEEDIINAIAQLKKKAEKFERFINFGVMPNEEENDLEGLF